MFLVASDRPQDAELAQAQAQARALSPGSRLPTGEESQSAGLLEQHPYRYVHCAQPEPVRGTAHCAPRASLFEQDDGLGSCCRRFRGRPCRRDRFREQSRNRPGLGACRPRHRAMRAYDGTMAFLDARAAVVPIRGRVRSAPARQLTCACDQREILRCGALAADTALFVRVPRGVSGTRREP